MQTALDLVGNTLPSQNLFSNNVIIPPDGAPGYRTRSKVVSDWLSRIPVCDGQNCSALFAFLLEVDKVLKLHLIEDPEILVLCLGKTSGFSTHLFSEGISHGIPLYSLVSRRDRERLFSEFIYRFQFPHESFRMFNLSVSEAASILNLKLREPQIVEIILENVSPLTRRYFVFSPLPCSFLELYSLASKIEGSLLAEREYFDKHPITISKPSRSFTPFDASSKNKFGQLASTRMPPAVNRTYDSKTRGPQGGNSSGDLSRVKMPLRLSSCSMWFNHMGTDEDRINRLISKYSDVIAPVWGRCDVLPYNNVVTEDIPFSTHHIHRRNNVTADALSRMAEDQEPIEVNDVVHQLSVIRSIPESFVSILEHQRNDPWCSEMMDKISKGDDEAFECLKRAHRKVANRYNRGRVPVSVTVGDSVLCKCYPQSSAVDKISAKLSPKWSGPWRVERFLTPDELARKAVEAIIKTGGPRFEVGSSSNVLSFGAGGADDFAKGRANIKYAYTVEMPGGGPNGFDLPATSLCLHLHSLYQGLRVMVKALREE
uniref:Peptidase M14 domain-containing protein n=1 Tax=Timema cristinae TaxID=61476 RepID=A0A7R9D9E6_TIMCR|nr:unnamed protein product [Timema cristinae]